jgi:menaquinone-9 beta-reductase
MHPGTCETEVLVVGGGPAGLAAALAARQAGFDVLVADSAHPPIDKACGEGIMPDGLAALERLGVRLDVAKAAPFSGIRFINGAQQAEARFCRGVGLGVRRTTMHEQLVNAATLAGVRLLWERRVTALADGPVLLDGESVRCGWVIGADGQNSRIRQFAGLGDAVNERVRFGFRQHYRVKPWSEFVEVHWGDCGQMYVTPISADEICVAFITSQKSLRLQEALGRFPQLASCVAEAVTEEPPRGAVTASRCLPRVHHQRVALIGEAAGSVDAITGEGLAIAFRQAIALADALVADDLSLYEAAHRRIMGLPRTMAALMLSMDGRPAFRRRLFRAFEAHPEIFARMLAIHTGAVSPVNFGVRNGWSLGWHLLTAKS